MHQLPDGRVVDGLGRRNQGDAALAEAGHDERVVDAVASYPGQFVDEDVGHVARGADTREQLLERDPLGHLPCGPTWFDVFIDDRDAELRSFALTCEPLGGNRDALRVVVACDLPDR